MLGFQMRLPRNGWLFNCCVSPQSEIGRVKIDRSLIGAPSDFRHIAHLGAADLSSSGTDANAFGALLRSKGGADFPVGAVPQGIRAADVPIARSNEKRQEAEEQQWEEGSEDVEEGEKGRHRGDGAAS